MKEISGVLHPNLSTRYGILLMLLATGCGLSMDASAKQLSSDLPLLLVVWGRYLFSLLFVGLFFFRGDPVGLMRTRRLGMQIFRSLLGLGAMSTFWWGLKYFSLADCVTLAFISPLLLTALSVPFLGEKVGVHRWVAVCVGFGGVLFIIRPGFAIVHWAVVLPLTTALFWANYQLTTRILGQTESALTTLFYSPAGGLAFTSLVVPLVWVSPTLQQWGVLAWMGFLGSLLNYLMIKAFQLAPVATLAPFSYTSLLWATLLDLVLFSDLPDAWTLAGAGIIIASGMVVIRREGSAAG